MSKVFIDTNIFVYTMDSHNPGKRERCRSLLRSLLDSGRTGVISTQVLQEFYVAATKKLGAQPLLAKNILHSLENYEIVTVDSALIQEAIDCSILSQLAFRDALIIVSAERACCERIWTEDLNAGQLIRGIRVVNPMNSGNEQ
jgi:predicted nucleic acid-binding protein